MAKYNELSSASMKNTESIKIARALLIGCAVGATVCAILLSLTSVLLVKVGNLPIDLLPIITTVIGAVGAFFGGYFTVKLYKKRGLLMGLVAGFIMFLIVFVTGLASGIESDPTSIIIKCAVFAVIGSIGGVVRVNKKTKVKKYA